MWSRLVRTRGLQPALLVLVLVSLALTLFAMDTLEPHRRHDGVTMLIQPTKILGASPLRRVDRPPAPLDVKTDERDLTEDQVSPVTAAEAASVSIEATEIPTPTAAETIAPAPTATEEAAVRTPTPTEATAVPTPASTLPHKRAFPIRAAGLARAIPTAAPTQAPLPTPAVTQSAAGMAIESENFGRAVANDSSIDSASAANESTILEISPVEGLTPSPSPTRDPMFPIVKQYPRDATTHNELLILRSRDFDTTVSRDKGIIVSLHNGVMAMGLSLIKELRCLGNHELIQVYYCLPKDLSRENQELLVNHDNRLEVIDVCSDLIHAGVFSAADATKFVNWWAKPLAIHHTDLQEPILLDADDILLQDPAVVRTTEGYQQNGTMFFYDRVIECNLFFRKRLWQRSNAQLLQHLVAQFDYAAFNLTGPHPSQHLLESFAYQDRTCHEMDSSLVAIDKTRAGPALDVLWYLITKLRHQVEFSWGDKEAFWLAYELAHVPYAFSPWGVSVVNSAPNKDLENHADTLCGSIAQYAPTNDSSPAEVFYINGRALLDPFAQGVSNARASPNLFYNDCVTHATPRQIRTPRRTQSLSNGKLAILFPQECLVGLGSTPLPTTLQKLLFRRRFHYLAITSNITEPLLQC